MLKRDEIRVYAAHALTGLITNGPPNSDIINDDLAQQAWEIGVAMMEQEERWLAGQAKADREKRGQ